MTERDFAHSADALTRRGAKAKLLAEYVMAGHDGDRAAALLLARTIDHRGRVALARAAEVNPPSDETWATVTAYLEHMPRMRRCGCFVEPDGSLAEIRPGSGWPCPPPPPPQPPEAPCSAPDSSTPAPAAAGTAPTTAATPAAATSPPTGPATPSSSAATAPTPSATSPAPPAPTPAPTSTERTPPPAISSRRASGAEPPKGSSTASPSLPAGTLACTRSPKPISEADAAALHEFADFLREHPKHDRSELEGSWLDL